jgi:hypothetical protein
VNAALAAHASTLNGKVKVTAFDLPLAADGTPAPPQAAGTCDALLFPACLCLASLPEEAAGEAVAAALAGGADAAAPASELPGLTLLVCTHRARDARCGALGPPLAAALGALGASAVLTSHVGGHKWAGNLIVYGGGHPAHGHWFGGLSAADAPAFLGALRGLQAGEDPAGQAALRGWWRGRSGMSKDEQMQHFRRCGGEVGDIEDAA